MKSADRTIKTKPREVRGRVVKVIGKGGAQAAYFTSDQIRMMKKQASIRPDESKQEGDAVSNMQERMEETIQATPYRAYRLTAAQVRMIRKHVKKRKEKAAAEKAISEQVGREQMNVDTPSSEPQTASVATASEKHTSTADAAPDSPSKPEPASKKKSEAAKKSRQSRTTAKKAPLEDPANRPLSAREISKGREKRSRTRKTEQASGQRIPAEKKEAKAADITSADAFASVKRNKVSAPRTRPEPTQLQHERPEFPQPKPREIIRQPVKSDHIIERQTRQAVKTADAAARTMAKQQAAANAAKANVQLKKKAAQTAAKNAERAAKHMAEWSRKAAQRTQDALKAASKAAIRAAIAAEKALVAVLAAGGWAIVLIIIVLLMCVCILASPFGIFTHTDSTEFPDSITLDKAITTINAEYVDEIVDMGGNRSDTFVAIEGNLEGGMEPANWVDVLAIYSVHLTMREDNAMDVVQLDKKKVQELRDVFWDMNRLSRETDTDESGETVRYILGTSRSYLEMADEYRFTDQQRQMLSELMSDEYYAFWSNFVSESMGYAPNDWSGIIDVGDYVPSMSGSVMNIPKLYQFDYRKTICVIDGKRKSVSTSGCGATSMSMVIRYLTGNDKQTPYTLFKWAYDNGYYSGDGLGHSAVSKMGDLCGVTGSWIGKEGKRIVSALKSGHPVIAHMGPGIFTKQGHYIVLRGVTDDGKILVNDPNSKSRSGKAYPLSTILNQSKTSEPFMICSAKTN